MDCLNCHKCDNLGVHSWRYRCTNCNCANYFHKSFVRKEILGRNDSTNWVNNLVSTLIVQKDDYIYAMELAAGNGFLWLPIGIKEDNMAAFTETYKSILLLEHNDANILKREMLIALQVPLGDCHINSGEAENEQMKLNLTVISENDFKNNRDSNSFGLGEVEDVDISENCLNCKKSYYEEDKFCVRITHSGTASWHTDCFRCSKCHEHLVDFHYYWDESEGSIYCMRHFDDLKATRCGSCGKLIFDKDYTKAMDENHHVEHFTCIQCNESLTGLKYIVKDEKPFCLNCYETMFSHVCDRCSEKISCNSKDLAFETRHWHEACFHCDGCQDSLVEKSFAAKEKEIFCPLCYDNKFGIHCTGCGVTFLSGVKKFEYAGKQWHEECFRCAECQESIGSKSFIPKNEKTLCIKCFEENYAQKCSKCKEIIRKGGITYKCEPWHKECFLCTNCNKELANTKFTSKEDKPYCGDCFSELFSKRCKKCEKPISGFGGCKFISLEDEHWHTECFNCAKCETNLVGKGFVTHNLEILCAVCGQVETEKK